MPGNGAGQGEEEDLYFDDDQFINRSVYGTTEDLGQCSEGSLDAVNDETFGGDVEEIRQELEITEASGRFYQRRHGERSSRKEDEKQRRTVEPREKQPSRSFPLSLTSGDYSRSVWNADLGHHPAPRRGAGGDAGLSLRSADEARAKAPYEYAAYARHAVEYFAAHHMYGATPQMTGGRHYIPDCDPRGFSGQLWSEHRGGTRSAVAQRGYAMWDDQYRGESGSPYIAGSVLPNILAPGDAGAPRRDPKAPPKSPRRPAADCPQPARAATSVAPHALESFTGYVFGGDDPSEDLPLASPRGARRAREHHSSKSIMTPKDVEYIFRIQTFQLVSDSPHRDDYYCKMFELNSSESNSDAQKSTGPHQFNWQQRLLLSSREPPRSGGLGASSANTISRLKSIIDDCVHKKAECASPRATHPTDRATTLGDSITRVTFKTPRKLILVSDSDRGTSTATGKLDPMFIERLYDVVLEMETLRLRDTDLNKTSPGLGPGQQRHLHAPARDADDLRRELEGGLDLSTPAREGVVHRTTQVLNASKGMRLLPRLLAFLGPTMAVKILSIMANQADMLNIFNGNHTPKEVDTFLNWGLPALATTILRIPLSAVSELTKSLVRKWVPTDPQGSRPGLGVLTLALSRAEMLKSKPGELSSSDLEEWECVYETLVSLSRAFISCFFHPKPAQSHDTLSDHTMEDTYAWQFFVSLVENAPTFDGQLSLMSMLKRNIMDVVRLSEDFDKLSGVNRLLSVFELKINDIIEGSSDKTKHSGDRGLK